MPNHIKNRVTITGTFENVDSILSKYSTYVKAGHDLTADEEKIICEKADEFVGWFDLKNCQWSTYKEKSGTGFPEGWRLKINDSYLHFPDFEKIVPMPKVIKDTIGQPGINVPWYTWSIENWGTKWNSYSCERLSCNVFQFETAWSNVAELLARMTKNNVEIFYEWADEDTGYNCGYAFLRNGTASIHELEGGTREAFELAFKLHPDHKEYYELVGGKYQSKEEETP